MSPYTVIEVTRGSTVRSFKGPTHKNGHKTPMWNWDMDMFYGGEPASQAIGADQFKVVVWSEEVNGTDKLIGES